MKKLIILAVSAIFILCPIMYVNAEYSKTAMTGKDYTDRNVYIMAYNNYVAENKVASVTAGSVVVLDLNVGSDSATNSKGIYFTIGNVAATTGILGVADETIASGTVGRILIRGVRRVLTPTIVEKGNLVGGSTTFGGAGAFVVHATGATGGVLGMSLGGYDSDETLVNVNPYDTWSEQN